MRKIEYNKISNIDIKKEYLTILGLYDIDNTSQKTKLDVLETQWKTVRTKYPNLLKLPDKLSDLLCCNFSTLIDYYLDAPILIRKDKRKKNQASNDEKEINEIENIINYTNYASSIKKFFNKYINDLDLYSCPYCETAYIGYFKTTDKEYNYFNQSNYETDHFFPKSKYPMFALSLSNFVPSCQMCNQRIKKTYDFDKDPYFNNLKTKEEKKSFLLKISPVSPEYNFYSNTNIKYVPKLFITKTNSNSSNDSSNYYTPPSPKNGKKIIFNYSQWHYFPIAQDMSEKYKVFFDTDNNPQSCNNKIIEYLKLADRYDTTAIKSTGLFFIDLKKRYSVNHIQMISDLLTKNGYPVSPDQIHDDLFHTNEPHPLLSKLRKDILE